jgi:hypothetical protein
MPKNDPVSFQRQLTRTLNQHPSTLLSTLPTSNNLIQLLLVLLLLRNLLQENPILGLEQLLLPLVAARVNSLARLAQPIHNIPQRLADALLVRASGFGAQHSRAVHDSGVHVPRDHDRHLAGRGDEVHEHVVLALRAGHEDRGEDVAGAVHGFDDLVGLQRDELERAVVGDRQRVHGLVVRQADHGAFHVGVCDRGAVAEQVAVEEVVPAQVRDGRGVDLVLHLAQMLVQVIVNVHVERLRHGHRFLEGRVGFDDVLEQFARRGLAAFGHPVVWDQDVAVGAPDAVDEDGLLAHGQVAGRGSGDGGEAREGLRDVVFGRRVADAGAAEFYFGADGADPAGVGVDYTAADCDGGGEAEVVGGFLGEGADFFAGGVELVVLGGGVLVRLTMQGRGSGLNGLPGR